MDRPEVEPGIARVTGPFTVDGTIPPPVDMGPRIDADERGSDQSGPGSGIDPRSSAAKILLSIACWKCSARARCCGWTGTARSLKGTYDDAVWDHLAGTTSTPFEPGEYRQVAVKVIDDRGNEWLVVRG